MTRAPLPATREGLKAGRVGWEGAEPVTDDQSGEPALGLPRRLIHRPGL